MWGHLFFLLGFIHMVVLQTSIPSPGSKKISVRTTIIGADTLPQLQLPEVLVSGKMPFASEEDAQKYRNLVRDIRRVYPFAIRIAIQVQKTNLQLAHASKGEKKVIMKTVEGEMKVQFEKAFRANTVKQAQLLIKLVDRETGNDSYHLIKQFKGRWNALLWQSVARLVGTNLKDGYDPNGEDKEIEKIIKQIEAE